MSYRVSLLQKKKAKLPPSGNKLKVDRSAEAMPYTTPGVRVVEGQKSRSNLPDAPEKIRQHNKIAISPRTIESSTGDHNINRLVSSSASTPIAKTPIRQENSSPETREDAESADVRENSRIRYRSDNKRQKVDGSSVTAAVANASTNVDKTLPDMHQDLQLYNSISAIYMPHKRLYEPLKIGPPPKVRRVGIVDFQLPAVLNEVHFLLPLHINIT